MLSEAEELIENPALIFPAASRQSVFRYLRYFEARQPGCVFDIPNSLFVA